MNFEHGPGKSASNKTKHGISLQEAEKLWSVTGVEFEAKNIDEPRFMLIGMLNSKLYSCIYTYRDNAIRLISARRSRKTEEKLYYDHIKK
jgi:uncharacterized DUF497 family protein